MDYDEATQLADEIDEEYDIDNYVKKLSKENQEWFNESVSRFVGMGMEPRQAKIAVVSGLVRFFEGKYQSAVCKR